MKKLDRRFLDASLVVESVLAEPPASPAAGVQYIVSATPTTKKAFEGHANAIAKYDGTAWDFFAPQVGDIEVFNKASNALQKWNGTAWVNEMGFATAGGYPEVLTVHYILGGKEKVYEKSSWGNMILQDGLFYVGTGFPDNSNEAWIETTLSNEINKYYYFSDENKIYTYKDDGSLEFQYSLPVGQLIFNNLDKRFYRYNGTSLDCLTSLPVIEKHTLTATDITNQYFPLSNPIFLPKLLEMSIFFNGVLLNDWEPHVHIIIPSSYSYPSFHYQLLQYANGTFPGEYKVGDVLTFMYEKGFNLF